MKEQLISMRKSTLQQMAQAAQNFGFANGRLVMLDEILSIMGKETVDCEAEPEKLTDAEG